MSISFKYLALGRHLWINTCFFLSLCEHPLLLQKEAGPELVQAAGFAIIVSQTITESSTKINSHLSDRKRVFLVGCNHTVLVLVNSTVISMWWCWRALGVPWVCFIPAPGAEMATRVLLVNLVPRFSQRPSVSCWSGWKSRELSRESIIPSLLSFPCIPCATKCCPWRHHKPHMDQEMLYSRFRMLHGDKLGIRLGSTLFSSSNLLSLPAKGELSSAAVWPRLTSALVGVLIWCLTRGAVPTESVQLSFPVPLSSFQGIGKYMAFQGNQPPFCHWK